MNNSPAHTDAAEATFDNERAMFEAAMERNYGWDASDFLRIEGQYVHVLSNLAWAGWMLRAQVAIRAASSHTSASNDGEKRNG
jgi:hypothetical protein